MRRTKYIVYVAAELMEDPNALLDATMTHFIRKGVDTALRKQFMAHVMKRGYDAKAQLAIINDWVQIRDVATFPFPDKLEEVASEDTPATRGVPVDNAPVTEPESGVASDGGDTPVGKGNAGFCGRAD